MAMLLSEMITQVRLNIGNRSNLTDAYIRQWLNWSMTDAATIRNWSDMKGVDESVTTRADGLEYQLPQGLKDILYASYLNGSQSLKLVYKSPRMFNAQFPHPEEDGSGTPSFYTKEGEYLKLWRTPNEAGHPIRLFCTKWPQAFNANADDECPLERLEKAIIERASGYGARAIADWNRMTIFNEAFNKSCLRLSRVDGNPSDWTPIYASEPIQRDFWQTGLMLPISSDI